MEGLKLGSKPSADGSRKELAGALLRHALQLRVAISRCNSMPALGPERPELHKSQGFRTYELPKWPICEEYHSTQFEYCSTRLE